ncbi:hypothetical protein SDJN03_01695, partial [Cucurbita argyrosperma subsp. sororia]
MKSCPFFVIFSSDNSIVNRSYTSPSPSSGGHHYCLDHIKFPVILLTIRPTGPPNFNQQRRRVSFPFQQFLRRLWPHPSIRNQARSHTCSSVATIPSGHKGPLHGSYCSDAKVQKRLLDTPKYVMKYRACWDTERMYFYRNKGADNQVAITITFYLFLIKAKFGGVQHSGKQKICLSCQNRQIPAIINRPQKTTKGLGHPNSIRPDSKSKM